MIKTYSTKTYWILVLCYLVMQIFLPKAVQYFFHSVSLFCLHGIMLLISIVFLEAGVLRCYSSSKLRKVIMVWISSSAVLTVSNMFGFFLFNKEGSHSHLLFIFGQGLFLMLFYLLLIIRSHKKEGNNLAAP
jgi:FlaA1/EpsC-like NDP-sugar epimerase